MECFSGKDNLVGKATTFWFEMREKRRKIELISQLGIRRNMFFKKEREPTIFE